MFYWDVPESVDESSLPTYVNCFMSRFLGAYSFAATASFPVQQSHIITGTQWKYVVSVTELMAEYQSLLSYFTIDCR